jgi:hypothetical protein
LLGKEINEENINFKEERKTSLNLEGTVMKKKEKRNRSEWIKMLPSNLKGLTHILKVITIISDRDS